MACWCRRIPVFVSLLPKDSGGERCQPYLTTKEIDRIKLLRLSGGKFLKGMVRVAGRMLNKKNFFNLVMDVS